MYSIASVHTAMIMPTLQLRCFAQPHQAPTVEEEDVPVCVFVGQNRLLSTPQMQQRAPKNKLCA